MGVPPSAVAVGSQVSVFAGLIAANLPAGGEVLTAAGDFTSILFPFLAQSGRTVRVREVPLERICDLVTPRVRRPAVCGDCAWGLPRLLYGPRNSRAFWTNCAWNWKMPPWPASW